jgi:hypothetical protein
MTLQHEVARLVAEDLGLRHEDGRGDSGVSFPHGSGSGEGHPASGPLAACPRRPPWIPGHPGGSPSHPSGQNGWPATSISIRRSCNPESNTARDTSAKQAARRFAPFW